MLGYHLEAGRERNTEPLFSTENFEQLRLLFYTRKSGIPKRIAAAVVGFRK